MTGPSTLTHRENHEPVPASPVSKSLNKEETLTPEEFERHIIKATQKDDDLDFMVQEASAGHLYRQYERSNTPPHCERQDKL